MQVNKEERNCRRPLGLRLDKSVHANKQVRSPFPGIKSFSTAPSAYYAGKMDAPYCFIIVLLKWNVKFLRVEVFKLEYDDAYERSSKTIIFRISVMHFVIIIITIRLSS